MNTDSGNSAEVFTLDQNGCARLAGTCTRAVTQGRIPRQFLQPAFVGQAEKMRLIFNVGYIELAGGPVADQVALRGRTGPSRCGESNDFGRLRVLALYQ